MPEQLRRVVVVGAGVAGLTAADTLRRRGWGGTISVVGAEEHRPYDRPPLSKQVLSGGWGLDRILLRSSPALTADDAHWYLGESAVRLDLDNRVVHTSRDRTLPFDGLVVASGSRPRRLPFGDDFANTHLLRTWEDAVALREAFAAATSVVVIGAGFLGCEVAAAACAAGLSTTLVDPLSTPMERHLGPVVGSELARVHHDRGVRLLLGRGVVAVGGEARAECVVLADGTSVEADLVVAAIGGEPDVDWLAGSGMALDDGLVCDERLTAAPGVVAAGDVASWFNPTFGHRMRVEHRSSAQEQGVAAAATLLGGTEAYAALPYFWSEQHDVRINAYGHFALATDLEVVAGSVADRRFAAVLHAGDDGVVAGLTWNLPSGGLGVRQRILDACEVRRGVATPAEAVS
ncbi:FAD-dependent oxidoreductase [Intrasporangium mesophilum]